MALDWNCWPLNKWKYSQVLRRDLKVLEQNYKSTCQALLFYFYFSQLQLHPRGGRSRQIPVMSVGFGNVVLGASWLPELSATLLGGKEFGSLQSKVGSLETAVQKVIQALNINTPDILRHAKLWLSSIVSEHGGGGASCSKHWGGPLTSNFNDDVSSTALTRGVNTSMIYSKGKGKRKSLNK